MKAVTKAAPTSSSSRPGIHEICTAENSCGDSGVSRGASPDRLPNGDHKQTRSKKTNTACQHFDRKHYAKNMCNNCYHREGRFTTASSCPHKDRKLYAKGKCQYCYLSNYHRRQVFGRRKKHKPVKSALELEVDSYWS
jgi:hypothetical protein